MPQPQRRAKPTAQLVQAPPYIPELDAYGLRLNEYGQVIAAEACPDVEPGRLMADPNVRIDARLWEGRFEHGQLRESRVTPRMGRDELNHRYTKLRESDWFSLGYSGIQTGESSLTSNYTPLIPGPATRQQYWAEYWASSAKAFEASTHSGIAKRACRAMVQFPLGRGVRWKIQDEKAQQAWEQFWNANNMRRRLRSIFYDLAVFGEQFLRYFPAQLDGKGRRLVATKRGATLIVRQLDPATIYEIVSDQEDLETVFFYHQQFQTRQELYSPPKANRAPEGPTPPGVTRYIIRQIDAAEIDHWRINDVSGEARGRSDLFPALGDLKRLRDLMTSKVIATDIGNRVMAILKANGTPADISRLLNTIFPGGQPPAPGTIIGLNAEADMEPFAFNAGREVRADFTYDEIVDSISAATGIARAYLGLSPAQGSGTTQATALTTTEPSVQTFEERQDIADELLHQMFDRVMEQAGINGEIEREFIFPEIASEDTAAKLDQLEQAEANGWVSKRTSASLAAAELDLTDYDFDEEMERIVEEFKDADEADGEQDTGILGPDGKPIRQPKPAQGGKIRRPMIRATSRQEPKLDPTKAALSEDQPPGQIIGPDGKPMAAPGATPGGAGGGGGSASKNPASATGRTTIKRQTRESDGHLRRTPDDPEFAEHASEFERQTAENLRQLLADLA